MTFFQTKLLTAVLLFVFTLLAGWYPFQKKRNSPESLAMGFPIGEALASGVFLGAGLIHMLGDAVESFAALHVSYPLPFVLVGVMFLFLLWLEHIGTEFYEHKGGSSVAFASLAILMLSEHAFLAGAALGLTATTSVFSLILVAIVSHKWAASFALAVQINKSSIRYRVGQLCFLLFALMTPLGIFFGGLVRHEFTQSLWLSPVINSLAAGTFLYLGTLHGLERAVMVSKCCNLKHFSFVILGFSLMAFVAIWT